MDKSILDKINRYSQTELNENQVFVFNVILCDNDIDRDSERFSDDALEQLKSLFIGKTGISDHNPKSSLQNARIFDTEVISDPCKKTSDGREYKYLKASVYMVRTDSNRDLISEIEGGIKKEVSISCSASSRKCSVCNCNKNTSSCVHTKGKKYGSQICHTVLSDITDAYEWSFVAVPAQKNAGVTKHFNADDISIKDCITNSFISDVQKELHKDIIRLAFIKGGEPCVRAMRLASSDMNINQLLELKKSLDDYGSESFSSQLFKNHSSSEYTEFSTK